MRRMKSPSGRFTLYPFSNFIKAKDINKTSAGVLPDEVLYSIGINFAGTVFTIELCTYMCYNLIYILDEYDLFKFQGG